MVRRAPQPVADNQFALIVVTLLVIGALAVAGYCAYRHFAGTPSAQSPAAMPPAQQVLSENDQLYGGMPQPDGPDQRVEVLRNKAYVVGYSEKFRDPLWVAYHLAATGNHVAPPRPKEFMVDDRTTARVENRDYAHSGYDKGHMCPNHAIAIHFGADEQEETFRLSNVVPQKHTLNAGVWEDLEREESDTYPNTYGEVWVIDGPIFHDPVRTLDSGVAIPDACYKIIVRLDGGRGGGGGGGGQPHVLPVIMPQTVGHDHVIDHYLTSVRQIESQTHLQFFTALPAQVRQQVEDETPGRKW
jgi:endonuclease G